MEHYNLIKINFPQSKAEKANNRCDKTREALASIKVFVDCEQVPFANLSSGADVTLDTFGR